jgi:hypothetical protein
MKLNNATLFKYVPGEDYNYESIIKNYFYFSRIKQVNDPQDCIVSPTLDLSNVTREDVLEFIISNGIKAVEARNIADMLINDKSRQMQYVELYRKQNEIVDERFRNKVKILCLTNDPGNYYMWSNYAKRITERDGFCIGYSCPPSSSKKIVNIHNSYRVPLLADQIEVGGFKFDFHVAVQVHYGDNPLIPYNPFLSNKEHLIYSYYYKKKKWYNEQEYRCVLSDTMTFGNDIQAIKYPPSILTAIIFGEKSSSETILKVKDALKKNANHNVKYYLSKVNNGNSIEIYDEKN